MLFRLGVVGVVLGMGVSDSFSLYLRYYFCPSFLNFEMHSHKVKVKFKDEALSRRPKVKNKRFSRH